MRALVSLGAFVLLFLAGGRTEWVSVSKAAQATSNGVSQTDQAQAERAPGERAYEAVVLGITRPDATSGELIDAAVTRGEISSERALLYGVYLACGDPRLPAEFRGQDVVLPAQNILWEADVDWASLPLDIRQALHAFFSADPAASSGSACAAELARLKGDPAVWWASALQEQTGPVQLANTQ